MEIAIVGIDGAGKTTYVAKEIKRLKAIGLRVGYINLPYFDDVGLLKQVGDIYRRFEKLNIRTLSLVVVLLAILFYIPARFWFSLTKDVIFTEHQPYVDLPVFARIYCGKLMEYLVRLFRMFLPEPQQIIFVNLEPQEAEKRVIRRGEQIQFHEKDLRRLDLLLRREIDNIRKSGKNCIYINT